MQERLLTLEASKKDTEEKLKTKRVTLQSAVVIHDEEPSHRASEEPADQEPRIKKSRKHANYQY